MVDYNAESIKHYTALQHMRKKSSMYGFKTSSVDGNLIQIKEIVDNSIDEARDQSRMYDIFVTYFVAKDKSTYQVLVQDFGLGIPKEKLLDCFTKEFTSGKYEESHGYQSSSIGTNGIGSKVVAALSDQFYAFTKRMDGFAFLKVERGEVRDSQVMKRAIDRNKDTVGTTVLFQPDPTILVATKDFFGKNELGEEAKGYTENLNQTEFYMLFKKNIRIHVRVVDDLLKKSVFKMPPEEMWRYLTNSSNFTYSSDVVFNPLSPREYVVNKFDLKEIIWEPGVELKKEHDLNNPEDRLGFDIDVFIDPKTIKGEGGLIGAVNATPISDLNSTHFTMLQSTMKLYLSDFIMDKDKKLFFETKYQIPLSGCVSVTWKGAGFDGQDKSKFTDVKFGEFYRVFLRRILNKVPESVWERLVELITENFEMAFAKYSKSQYKMNKSLNGIGYLLNRTGSYFPCRSRDSSEIELFITEGDSAAGRVKTVRDERIQALFKLSGKPINAVRADAKKLLKNLIYQDLMELIGVRPTDKDLSNMRFSKIILLADADADGYHIVALLIGIFKEINPLILEEGRIYIANPPLYSLRVQGQKRPLYLRDQGALIEAKTEIYRTLLDVFIEIGNNKPKLLSKEEYVSFCAIVEKIGDRVSFIADQLNIDRFLLEQLMHCADYLDEKRPDVKMVASIMSKAGVEDVQWDKTSNTLMLVEQGLDSLVSLSHLKETIKNQIIPLYEDINWRTWNLYVSTRYTDLYAFAPCSIMMLYVIFKNITDTDNSKYFAITRFKGLGEMDEAAIKGTCIDNGRCVSRICGMGDVNVIYNMLGVDSEARKQLNSRSVHGRLVENGFLEE